MNYADKLTEERLDTLIKDIKKTYGKAAVEMAETVREWKSKFAVKDAEMREMLDAGEITADYYKKWRLNNIGQGKRFKAMQANLAEQYNNASETAMAYINDTTPGIYTLCRNHTAYMIEQVAGKTDVGHGLFSSSDFTVVNAETARILVVDHPDLMPRYPIIKAIDRKINLAYGKTQITNAVTSGILQGHSIDQIAADLLTRVVGMGQASAIRSARTAVTNAQNGGRQDTYEAAENIGIVMQKEWVSTPDERTREAHRDADGQIVPTDSPFTVGGEELMFPGDTAGSGWNLYNCRCTTRAVLPEFPYEYQRKIWHKRDDGSGFEDWVLLNEAKQ